MDELFDREELSAAPDAGWPDCFNSGVFVFRPSEETYDSLLKFAMSQGSFDGKARLEQIWKLKKKNEFIVGATKISVQLFSAQTPFDAY